MCLEESDSGHDDRSVSTETCSALSETTSRTGQGITSAETDSAAESLSDENGVLQRSRDPPQSEDRTGYKVVPGPSIGPAQQPQGGVILRQVALECNFAVESDSPSGSDHSATTA